MAPLPSCRLRSNAPAFANTGVDLFGPIEISIFRCRVKRWVALFTCMTTRAVHLEVVYCLEADSVIAALTRFEAERGVPAAYLSDNATNFVGADRELKECLTPIDGAKISALLSRREVKWVFIPSGAPHFGGAWERLIQSAKRALRYILHLRTLNDEVLSTSIKQVQALMNSRPLTPLSSDPLDPEPLTPSHLVLGRANPNLPPDIVGEEEVGAKKRWRAAQAIATHFWRRWMREYLPGLTDRKKWHRDQRNLAVGDVVLIISPSNPRGSWPMGLVVEVCPGSDGIVRSVYVKTRIRPGSRETQTLHRSVDKLCLLDLSDDEKREVRDVPIPVGHRAGDVPDRSLVGV